MDRKRSLNLFFGVSCVAFVLVAMYLNTYGAVAPLMMEDYGIDAARQGLIVTMQSIGGTLAGMYLAVRGEAHNKLHAIAVWLLAVAAGTILMGFAPAYGLVLCLAALSGVGFSFVDVMVNGAISDMYDEDRDTRLSIAHAVYGGGAMCAPLLAALITTQNNPRSWTFDFITIGIGCAVVLIIYLRVARMVAPYSPYKNMKDARQGVKAGAGEVFRSPIAWILLAAGILYFSFQMGVSAWLPSFCVQKGLSLEVSNLMLTAFFGGSLVMGFACAVILKKIPAKIVFGLFGILSAVCLAGALIAPNEGLLAALVTASGFCQGCGVVTLVIVLTDAFPGRSASAASIQVVSANIGAITAPLWMGALADTAGYATPLLIGCGLYVAGAVLVLKFAPARSKQP